LLAWNPSAHLRDHEKTTAKWHACRTWIAFAASQYRVSKIGTISDLIAYRRHDKLVREQSSQYPSPATWR
jgi:hypothetical protein